MQPSMAPRTESARSKRRSIVAAAVNRFGSDGYEHTKWSTVADDVGVLGELAATASTRFGAPLLVEPRDRRPDERRDRRAGGGQALRQRMQGQTFALLSIHIDDSNETVTQSIASGEITWPCWSTAR